ncbi:MAG: ABC transporter transmembrane domain-containing protein, partial [Chloroflexota bacterium]
MTTTDVDKPTPLLRLIRYARPHRRQIWLASLCSVLNKVFDLAPPALIGVAVDIVVSQETSYMARLGITDVVTQLWVLGILTAVIWALESAFEYAFAVLWRNLAQTLQHELRLDAYGHVQNLEMAYFEDRSTGGLMSVLNDDINQLERFLDVGANDLIQVVTTVLVIGGLFMATAPSVAWMAVVPMPFVFWGSLVFQRRLAPRYVAVRERVGILNGLLSNNLGGIATIKSFTAESHELSRIEEESEAYRARNREAISLSAAFVPIIRMVIVTGFIAILIFGGTLVVNGQLNVGIYSVLVFMTQRLLWPLTRLGNTLDLYQRAMASTERILDLLDTEVQIVDGTERLPLENVAGEVAFEDVVFQYGENGPSVNGRNATVIHHISLRVPAGETIALVGSTGSGKTTMVKLLLRFYDIQGGRITLD